MSISKPIPEIFRKSIKYLVGILLIFTVVSFATQSLSSIAQSEEEQVKSTYSAKKAKITDSIAQTKELINKLKESYGEANTQKLTYQDQKKANEAEIDSNNQALTDYKVAIAQLDDQIQTKEKDIELRKTKIGTILKQIWQEKDSTTIDVLLSSENFSQIITGLNQLNSLEDSLLENIKSLETAKKDLESDRSQKLATQKDLEDAQIILNANKQKLEGLISEYANNEAKYAADIAQKEREAKENQDQIAQLQKEQESKLNEIRKRREEEIRKKAEEERLAALAKNGGQSATLSSTNPNAKSVISGNSGTTQYGSCNSVTMPGSFPVKFGEFGSPTDGALTQRYGSTTLSNSIYSCHTGVDVANSCGTPLWAIGDGIVYASDYAPGGYGNYILIEHNFGVSGKLYALYGHMKSRSVLPIGSRVSKGDIIGYMGSTGFSTGCHLHFTLIDGDALIYDRNRAGSSPIGLYYNPLDYVSV